MKSVSFTLRIEQAELAELREWCRRNGYAISDMFRDGAKKLQAEYEVTISSGNERDG